MVNGRDENGRFTEGHRLSVGNGGGRPKRSVEERCLAQLVKAVSEEDLDKMISVGLSRAKAGDIAWAKLLLGYLIGLPIQRTEISGPNGGKVEVNLTWGDYATDDGASPETA